MMENEFQMSVMGELTFFLGIQVKQTKQDIFIHQVKYTKDLMKKFNMDELKPVSAPMSITTSLDLDENGEAVDQREYMSMIDSLLYLTMTRSDIQFVMCLCARFGASPCSSHQIAVQRIFMYLKHTHEFGIWFWGSFLVL
jgi:isopentenyldiphosphate isomerase